MNQLFTRYFIAPFGSRIGWGVVAAAVNMLVGLVSLITGVAPMFRQRQLARIDGTEMVFFVEGAAAVYAAGFWFLIGFWLHALNYWSSNERLEKYAPITSNLALLAALVFGCVAVFMKEG